jgi:hypothetical protein
MATVIAEPVTSPEQLSSADDLRRQECSSVPPISAEQETWIQGINKAYGFSTGWALKTGDLLLEAKKKLKHGEWNSLFGPGRLKFGQRTAEMLMEIARHPSFRDPKNLASLPKAWSALHALSKLPRAVVDQGIVDGSIHSELTVVEARQLVQAAQATATTQSSPHSVRFDLIRQRKRVIRYLRAEVTRWPAEYRKQLAEVLQTAALDLLKSGTGALEDLHNQAIAADTMNDV